MMADLNEKEKANYRKYEEITRLFLIPAAIFLVVTFNFVFGSALNVLQTDYSNFEIIITAAFTCLVGFIISFSQHPRNWMGFAHFSALTYVIATLCSIPLLLDYIELVQPILLLTAIMFALTSAILFAKRKTTENH